MERAQRHSPLARPGLLPAIAQLHDFLCQTPLPITAEKQAQRDLEHAMTQAGFTFTREHALSERDVIDFLVTIHGVSIGLELKLRAQRKCIYKQLERYAAHDDVEALILLSGTAMGLPSTIRGKPAFVVSMGGAWL